MKIVHRSPHGDTFVFIYDDATKTALMEKMIDMANDPNTQFTWFDCGAVWSRVRK